MALFLRFFQERGADFRHPFVLDLPFFVPLGHQLGVVLELVKSVVIPVIGAGDVLVVIPMPFAEGQSVTLPIDFLDRRLEVVEFALDAPDEVVFVDRGRPVFVHGRLDAEVALLLQPMEIVLNRPHLTAEVAGEIKHVHGATVVGLDPIQKDAAALKRRDLPDQSVVVVVHFADDHVSIHAQP